MKISPGGLPLQFIEAGTFVLFFLMLLVIATGARGGEVDSARPQAELIAPGIWRLHFGNPEQFTPTHFRSAPMSTASLKAVVSNHPIPLDVAKISFQVSDRGCSLQLQMKPDERIYGFGLHTELFEMTGRKVFLKPTDKPENDLGESHAPAPFYVSSRGCGVFVDTARFASFYTGNVSPAENNSEPDSSGVATSEMELYRAR